MFSILKNSLKLTSSISSSSSSLFINTSTINKSSSLLLSRQFAVTGRHSKNVAGKKNKLDAAKSKLFNRLAVKIIMSVKAGGADPSVNLDLNRLLREAHSNKVPKENLERALKKGQENEDGEGYSSSLFEVYGHEGACLVVSCLSNNKSRANMTIKSVCRKSEAKVASMGSVLFQFDQKAVFTPTAPYDKDAVIEAAINADLEDIDFIPNEDNDDETPLPDLIITNHDQLGVLQDLLSGLSIPGSSSLAYLPQDKISISEEGMTKNFELIENLEELEDVDVVYHNINVN